LIEGDKAPQGPVVGLFDGIGEEAGGKFPVAPVVSEALTADAFPAAGLPGAIASLQILLASAFIHFLFSLYRVWGVEVISNLPVMFFPRMAFLVKIIGQGPAQRFGGELGAVDIGFGQPAEPFENFLRPSMSQGF